MNLIPTSLVSDLIKIFKFTESNGTTKLLNSIINNIVPDLSNYLQLIGFSGEALTKKLTDEIGYIVSQNVDFINELINKNIWDISVKYISLNNLKKQLNDNLEIIGLFMDIVKLLGINTNNPLVTILSAIINNNDNEAKYKMFQINSNVVGELKKMVGVYCENGMCILGGNNLENPIIHLLNILDESNKNKTSEVVLFLLNLINGGKDDYNNILSLLSTQNIGISNDEESPGPASAPAPAPAEPVTPVDTSTWNVDTSNSKIDQSSNDSIENKPAPEPKPVPIEKPPVTLPAPEPINKISKDCINELQSILDEYNGITKSFMLKFGGYDSIRNQIALFRNQDYLDIFDQSIASETNIKNALENVISLYKKGNNNQAKELLDKSVNEYTQVLNMRNEKIGALYNLFRQQMSSDIQAVNIIDAGFEIEKKIKESVLNQCFN